MSVRDDTVRALSIACQQDAAWALGVRAGENAQGSSCPYGEGPIERAWRKGYAHGQKLRSDGEKFR